jgi:hypothetical protein
MKTLKRLLFFMAGIIMLIACSKSDNFWGANDPPGSKSKYGHDGFVCKDKYAPGTIYNLSGLALYKTWTVKKGVVIQDAKYECTGTLEFLDDRNFIFSFQETRPDGNAATFSGKISASGIMNFKFPTPVAILPDGTELFITDIIKSHSCVIDIWGPGVNEGTLYVQGKFDGKRLTAETKFMARVDESCPELLNPSYNGLVHWIFGYDLTVDQD